MKKRILSILAVLLLLVLMTGCFGQNASGSDNGSDLEGTDSGVTTETQLSADESSTTEESTTGAEGTEEMPKSSTEEAATTEEQPASTEEEKEVVLDESKAVKMWITASTLNLRKAPNTSGEVLKVLKRGTEIKKYEETNGWALVKAGDIVGYVSTQYIAKEKPAEPTTANQEETTTSDKEQGSSKVEAIPGQHRNPNSAVVVIDPGHQRKGDSTKEPNGPGSTTMKARVTYGTTGVATGVTEYELNLQIALKLRTELENRGYTVYMTRTSHDVNMSNKERAEYGNSVGADAVIRIHANSADSSSVRGAETLSPSSGNPYISHLAKASQKLGKCVIDAYCKATGFKNSGMKTNDTMTGINWSEIPVTIIELGFMSSPEEDKVMQDSNMQNNMVQGMANGLDTYFGF